MKDYEIKYVDVFTTKKFRGSSVGVVTGADGLSTRDMAAVASEINLSESTYVTSPDSKDSIARVRFFTPET
ncbi:MAG TPA: PhzF family phenazine biosynthesis protein, partial [Candidatus Krumholzibacterium sp.]|nr:PhzF family phenazine biosynthesis protein [Candidatus Krumholzibacterium sp.]